MEASDVLRTRRNRMFRNYTIDEEDPDAEQDPRSSLSLRNGTADEVMSVQESFYRDQSTSRAPSEPIHTQIRDPSFDTAAVHGLPDEDADKESTVADHSRKTSIVRTESQRRDLRNFEFNLETPTSQSSYAHSLQTSQTPSQATGLTSLSVAGCRLPNFFSNEVFQTVLHNPTTAHQLLAFSKTRMCGENMYFLDKVHKYRALVDEVTRTMFDVHKEFLSPGGTEQINISEPLLLQVRKDMKKTITEMLPKLEIIFDDCSTEIERLVATDIYPRFVRHQMVISASKALATDRSKYAGLGDCFVLTNPSKADNPIVYTSDGFARVTGYLRHEIIPRNCRFLQGRQTDRAAVKRLRISIDEGQESVELLLNYKKNGEPFWNLLYITPLYDYEGRLAFFFGGQINCSTTIHNANDILRILAYSEEGDEDAGPASAQQPPPPPPAPKPDTPNFFKRFRSQKSATPPRLPGMESGLLTRIEKLDLSSQMAEFYTAYSKFIIVNAVTNFISFHSYGILALLYPVKPQKVTVVSGAYPENFNVVRPPRMATPVNPIAAQQQQPQPIGASTIHSVAGQDIFKFLMHHTMNGLSRDFKTTVKNAMKTGRAVSLELMLCTRRRMGFERFATHWTPLKDEAGRTEFMVLTLGALD